MKQDILIISRNFPPITGGIEKLMWNVFLNLSQHYRITFIGPRGSAAFIDAPHRCIECDEESPLRFLLQAAYAGWKASADTAFVFSVGGNGLIAPVCRMLQITRRLPCLLFLYGLDIIADNFIYQRLFVPCMVAADRVITISQNSYRLAAEAGIDPARTSIVYPGVDTPAVDAGLTDIRKQYNLQDRNIILSVGRLIKRKGVLEFIQHSMPEIVQQCPQIMYLVIGDEPAKALKKDASIRKQINAAIKQHHLEKHVLLLGETSDEILFSAYRNADALIFPIIDLPGDVEGFGMVAVEAAAHGTPTFAFRAGGVSDAVKHEETGILVNPGDYESMVLSVVKGIKGGIRDSMKAQCIEHSKTLSWSEFGKQTLQQAQKLSDMARR